MDIRSEFLEYFKKNGHLIMPSSSLIPQNDPSVLLTTAGMQQFKPYYLGTEKPPETRISTVQKCFRTSDIDSVDPAIAGANLFAIGPYSTLPIANKYTPTG